MPDFFPHQGYEYPFPYELPAGTDPADWVEACLVNAGLKGKQAKLQPLLTQWALLEGRTNLRIRGMFQTTDATCAPSLGGAATTIVFPLGLEVVYGALTKKELESNATTYFGTRKSLASLKPVPEKLLPVLSVRNPPAWIKIVKAPRQDEHFYAALAQRGQTVACYHDRRLVFFCCPLTDFTINEILSNIERERSAQRAVELVAGRLEEVTSYEWTEPAPHILFANAQSIPIGVQLAQDGRSFIPSVIIPPAVDRLKLRDLLTMRFKVSVAVTESGVSLTAPSI